MLCDVEKIKYYNKIRWTYECETNQSIIVHAEVGGTEAVQDEVQHHGGEVCEDVPKVRVVHDAQLQGLEVQGDDSELPRQGNGEDVRFIMFNKTVISIFRF